MMATSALAAPLGGGCGCDGWWHTQVTELAQHFYFPNAFKYMGVHYV